MKEDNKIEQFIASGILEQYVIGSTTASQNVHVEHMINLHAAIKTEYNYLQRNLEAIAASTAVVPPADLLDKITFTPEPKKTSQFNYTPWMQAASFIIGLISVAGLFYFINENTNLRNQIVKTDRNYKVLEENYQLNESERQTLEERLKFVKNPETEKFILKGNIGNENLKIIAYYNRNTATAEFEIAQLPALNNGTYQLWADVDGKMYSLAVLDSKKPRMITKRMLRWATDFNITIEKKGGSKNATIENLVATVMVYNE